MARTRWLALAGAVLVTGVLVVPGPAEAAPDVNNLNGSCVALQAPGGKYVVRNALGGYQATGSAPDQPFRLQRTGEASYLMYGKGNDFLSNGLGTLGVLKSAAGGPASEWQVAADGGRGRISSQAAGKQLTVDPIFTILALRGSGTRFTLVEATGCATAPEAEVNVTGDPF